MRTPSTPKIPVGISRCLIGDSVRFNGNHKHNRFCTSVLAEYFEFVPTCPEIEIGMSVPRKPIRLVQIDGSIKARESDDISKDYTDALTRKGQQFSAENPDICGFIATAGSPSCGINSTKLYLPNGYSVSKSSGLFSASLSKATPLLPMEEAGRLNDAALRENFIIRVYTYQRWQSLVKAGLTAKSIVDFHSRHKYLVMAHDHLAYKNLGQLVAKAGTEDRYELATQYITELMQALSNPPKRGKHCNVMHHLMGYLKKWISPKDKGELLNVIEDYRLGILPLIVPITLLKHHLQRWQEQQNYVLQQVYLSPYPHELGLRSQIQ